MTTQKIDPTSLVKVQLSTIFVFYIHSLSDVKRTLDILYEKLCKQQPFQCTYPECNKQLNSELSFLIHKWNHVKSIANFHLQTEKSVKLSQLLQTEAIKEIKGQRLHELSLHTFTIQNVHCLLIINNPKLKISNLILCAGNKHKWTGESIIHQLAIWFDSISKPVTINFDGNNFKNQQRKLTFWLKTNKINYNITDKNKNEDHFRTSQVLLKKHIIQGISLHTHFDHYQPDTLQKHLSSSMKITFNNIIKNSFSLESKIKKKNDVIKTNTSNTMDTSTTETASYI